MYNFFVIRGFAHRMMKNGLMESAPVEVLEGGGFMIDEKDFCRRGADDMNLSGGDYAQIESELQRYALMMPADYILPVNRKPAVVSSVSASEQPL